jgi:copper chaperone
MKTIALKTNINCSGCVAKVTPVLNETVGKENWNVDTQNPNKILTVTTEKFSEEIIINTVKKAGFKAETLS